jgi:AcrR family transcriptional regulator
MSQTRSTNTRCRILDAAADVFGEKGFSKASTREIARRARANIASLNYHFGDKAELYRSVFADHLARTQLNPQSPIDYDTASFAEIYAAFNRQFFSHITNQAFPRLLVREQLEPSGLLGGEWLADIRRRHQVLNNAICRELGLPAPDGDVERLAFMLIGMAVVFDRARPMIDMVAPGLNASGDWMETTLERLDLYARAVIDAERIRRRTLPA